MWLVLSDAHDASALWAHAKLKRRGLRAIEFVSAEQLALSTFTEHRLDGMRSTLRFRTEAGLQVDGDRLDGVVNRLYTVPVAHWRSAPRVDQDYVQQEMAAFFLSWIHALPCAVVNRPTPQGLCGQWRQESEWVVLARSAGLAVAPYRQSSRDRIDEMKGEKRLVPAGAHVATAVVVGRRVVGLPLAPAIAAACVRLAELASVHLLGVDFVVDPRGTCNFVGANPMPDLRVGGDALIEALLDDLTTLKAAA